MPPSTKKLAPIKPGILTLVRETPEGFKECRFEQSPPKGSKFVGDPCARRDGSVLFITPEGEYVLTPAIWYTLPWKGRIRYLQFWADRRKEEITELAKALRANPDDRDKDFELRQSTRLLDEMESAIRHIKRHADLEQCPSLNPIPASVRVKIDYFGRDTGWFGEVRCGNETEIVDGNTVDSCWQQAAAWLSKRQVALGKRPRLKAVPKGTDPDHHIDYEQ